MKNINLNLSNINSLSLSSIYEIDSNYSLSEQDFKQKIIERCSLLQKNHNIESSHLVILQNNNTIDFFINFLSLLLLDVTIIPLDDSLQEKEILNIANYSKANFRINQHGITSLFPEKNQTIEKTALILYTSGTTSTPKGVLISKGALIKKMHILDKFIGQKIIENTLCFLPTFFGHGLICNSLFPIFYGKKFFIAPKMDIALASNFSNILTDHKITFFSSVPSHWELLLNFSTPISLSTHLKRINCASAPLKENKMKSILNFIGKIPFYDVYGATEMLGWFADRRVKNNDEESQFEHFWDIESKLSETNELLVKADYMFSGYQNQKDHNIFFNTGDIFIDNKLVSRSKNVINKNGIKLYTEELNSLYLKFTELKEAASFPIDDDFTGENIGLFIVTNAPLDDFKKFLDENVPSRFHPIKIISVEKIPTNSRNKTSLEILKNKYKEMYGNK